MASDKVTAAIGPGSNVAETHNMAGKHVLIVDDEPRVALLLGQTLERSFKGKYQVTVAHSGEEALEVLERSPVDLLVTDLRMPGLSGLDLIRQVRATRPETRTILITAYGNGEVEEAARRLETYRYITKPFDMADFTRAVEDALQEVSVVHPGLILLSDACFEAIAAALENLCREIGAQCAFLADTQGQRLVEVGETHGLDVAALLALLAGGIAASAELAHQLGDRKAFNLNFHEGSRYDIYSATVEEGLFLAVVCNRQVQPSRVGLVWLYIRRIIEQLRSILVTSPPVTGSPVMEGEFGASLVAELDALLTPGGVPEEEPCLSGPSALPSPAVGAQEPELLDWETAVKAGLIPADLLGAGAGAGDEIYEEVSNGTPAHPGRR